MKKGNISSAVFTGLFVGVIVFIRELLFPNKRFSVNNYPCISCINWVFARKKVIYRKK